VDLFRKDIMQEAFAESDMVNWLTYPTELGHVPDKIELMQVLTIDHLPSNSPDTISTKLPIYLAR
jgi:hypothetical protein